MLACVWVCWCVWVQVWVYFQDMQQIQVAKCIVIGNTESALNAPLLSLYASTFE